LTEEKKMNRERQIDKEFELLWKRIKALELRVTYLEDWTKQDHTPVQLRMVGSTFNDAQQLTPGTITYKNQIEKI
jgi:hypothetical protein